MMIESNIYNKMDHSLDNFIGLNPIDLTVEDELTLRENLQMLEAKFRSSFSSEQDEQELARKLWVYLAKMSVKLQNTELSLISIARLKLVQLALLLRATLKLPDRINKLIALSYVANHFNMDNNPVELLIQPSINVSQNSSCIFDHNRTVQFLIDGGNWNEALEAINKIFRNEHHKQLNRQIVFYKLAQHSELDMDFHKALVNYEKSTTEIDHSARVIIKQFMDSAYCELKKYYSTTNNISMQFFWCEYSHLCECRRIFDSKRSRDSSENEIKFVFLKTGGLKAGEKRVFKLIPERMREFIDNTSRNKWTDRREIECMITMGTSLNSNAGRGLVELASAYNLANQITKACSIYLCLNQLEAFLGLSSKILDTSIALMLSSKLEATNWIAINTSEYLDSKKCSLRINGGNQQQQLSDEKRTLFIAFIKLGLIDEALQVFCNDPSRNDSDIIRLVKQLENSIEGHRDGSSESVDPVLTRATLNKVYNSVQSSSQISSTNVINVVILCVTTFLLKLNPKNYSDLDTSILPKLEIMFESLSKYSAEMNFNASDSLVRSTNALIVAVKDKLDALSESDIIRKSFRSLVETTASQSMIESRYKSAAMLYSQIEDNINAVKSLMRMGDVDIVINYSLLVRDITVTRLTINYLKHLSVDHEVIEDFIARSKL